MSNAEDAPTPADLSQLLGARILQVAVGEFEILLHLSDAFSVTLAGEMTVGSKRMTLAEARHALADVVGKALSKAEITHGDLHLEFDGSTSVVAHGGSPHEDFVITGPAGFLVVGQPAAAQRAEHRPTRLPAWRARWQTKSASCRAPREPSNERAPQPGHRRIAPASRQERVARAELLEPDRAHGGHDAGVVAAGRPCREPTRAIVLSMPDPARASRPMSLEEWGALGEDEPGELVDGVLVEDEDVGYLHETVVSFLVWILRNWLVGRGRVATSDARFAVTPRRGRKPDVTVYFARTKLPARGIVRTPPDIAIEVVSPTPNDRRRDRVEKLGEYAAFGARYYWIVDPELRTMEILELGPDRSYRIALAASEGAHAVPGCDGLSIDLDALWAEIADLDHA